MLFWSASIMMLLTNEFNWSPCQSDNSMMGGVRWRSFAIAYASHLLCLLRSCLSISRLYLLINSASLLHIYVS